MQVVEKGRVCLHLCFAGGEAMKNEMTSVGLYNMPSIE